MVLCGNGGRSDGGLCICSLSPRCYRCIFPDSSTYRVPRGHYRTGVCSWGSTVGIDDCWQDCLNPASLNGSYHDARGRPLVDAKRFPEGLRALSDYGAARGVALGWYICLPPCGPVRRLCMHIRTCTYTRMHLDTHTYILIQMHMRPHTASRYGNNCPETSGEGRSPSFCSEHGKLRPDWPAALQGDVAALVEYNFSAVKLDNPGCGARSDMQAYYDLVRKHACIQAGIQMS